MPPVRRELSKAPKLARDARVLFVTPGEYADAQRTPDRTTCSIHGVHLKRCFDWHYPHAAGARRRDKARW